MVDFRIIDERVVPLSEVPNGDLRELILYWDRKCAGGTFALRRSIDPTDIPKLLGTIRIVDIEPGGVFRFRLYGTKSLNPDRKDMTGLTTRDYEDTGFGDMVTRHYATVADDGQARCWRVKAEVDVGVYEFMRAVLPMSRNGDCCDMLLIKSERLTNMRLLRR